KLAERARIPLPAPTVTSPVPGPAETPSPYGLTGRELAVLRLVAAGRTNAQIGAELYISPRTAGVQVANILRKLGVTNRVQAAALAERAGLLDGGQTDGSVTHGGLGEGELSRLRSALGERARLVLVVGDAGIGKTRFVAEGLARSTTGGLITVSG